MDVEPTTEPAGPQVIPPEPPEHATRAQIEEQREAVRAWALTALERCPTSTPVTLTVGPVAVTAHAWDAGTILSVRSVSQTPTEVWSAEALAGAGMLLIAAADFCHSQDEEFREG